MMRGDVGEGKIIGRDCENVTNMKIRAFVIGVLRCFAYKLGVYGGKVAHSKMHLRNSNLIGTVLAWPDQ